MRRANRTRLVLLKIFGVDGSIWRPEPPVPVFVADPFPRMDDKPFRLRIYILVPGEADTAKTTLFLS